MGIKEYNVIYSQYIERVVERYVMAKYKVVEPITCFFNPYHVNPDTNAAHYFEPELVMLSKEDYSTLLKVIVKHRNLNFHELPLYISKELYQYILYSFNFIAIMEQGAHPFVMEEEALPIAVSMPTLMNDAKEIIGEKMCAMCLQSCSPYKEYDDASVFVTIWMGIMEVEIYCKSTLNTKQDTSISTHKEIYGMIDANAVLSALKVRKYKNVSSALWHLFESYALKDESDIKWLVRWLDERAIKYVRAEGELQRVYSGYGYKFKDIIVQ